MSYKVKKTIKNNTEHPLNREGFIELKGQLNIPERSNDIQPSRKLQSDVFQKCIRRLSWSQMPTKQKVAFVIFLIGSVTVIYQLDPGHSVWTTVTVSTEKTVFIEEAKICEEKPANMCCHRECQEQANQLQNGIDSNSCIDINKLFDEKNLKGNGSLRSVEDRFNQRLTDVLNSINLFYPDFVHELGDEFYQCNVFYSSETCLQKMKKNYPIALLFLYAKKYMTPGIFQLLKKIFDQIRDTLLELFDQFEENNKIQKIIDYLRKVELFVGMVDVFNGTHNVDLFTELEINFKKNKASHDSLNQQMEQFLFAKLDQKLTNYRSVNQKRQLAWILKNPFRLIPEYNLDLYRITLPIGLIQESFVGEHLPDSLNYGSIGTLIGRELTQSSYHIVHNFAIDYPPKFEVCQCFHQQYQEWAGSALKTCLKPSNFSGCTQAYDELIADLIGNLVAYMPLKIAQLKSSLEQTLPGLSKLTPSQLFWIRLATTYRLIPDCSCEDSSEIYPESRFRLLAILENSPVFKPDFFFNCPQLPHHQQTSNFFSSQFGFQQTCFLNSKQKLSLDKS